MNSVKLQHGAAKRERALRRSVAETIDRLMTLEVRPVGFMTGVVPVLYDAARLKAGGAPLAWSAAEGILRAVPTADAVIIVTGHVHPVVMPKGETDGPMGAAALARYFDAAFGLHPIILCDEQVMDVMLATLRGAGLLPAAHGSGEAPVRRRATVLPLSTDVDAAAAQADEILALHRVAATIAVEKIGPNQAGFLHSGLGNDLTGILGRGDAVVTTASSAGVLTIGIGDLGNEIGMGVIEAAVREHVPYADTCQCPCRRGTATATATDVLLVAGNSNWGAYALTAAMAAQTGRPDLIHDSEVELAMLVAASEAGAVDGLSGGTTREVDGLPARFLAHWIDLLREAVRLGTNERVSSRVAYEADQGVPDVA